MNRKIKSLEIIGVINDRLNANHDVIVELTDSKRYIATFFTLINIQYLMTHYEQNSGECNNGSFFWASDMCIVKVIDEKVITEAINTMLEDLYFDNVFTLIES
ncbi:hypothetical protein [Paraflavitalea sp. CAU 1676]|uniref:hypothetical protein n=1 Tax=Paraflavitalea sp. CAU 1676 TaxID=3032598 RepID=UPI0023D99C89|nr:hypothetical protein [Paraflavitalea sp. CAU 1676]MDF2193414.1 hypothetical protein [Paraflavitalea sp. CAU 1676]